MVAISRGRPAGAPQQPHDYTGLILSGGGARAAYQVGVLKAIAELMPPGSRSPFDIVCGTSAGAINAAAVASHAHRFRAGVRGLDAVWRDFHASDVYRTGFGHLSRSAARWLGAMFLGGLGPRRPEALLDNAPLTDLLRHTIRFERIAQAVDAGLLRALSVTVSCYGQGESVAFYQGVPDLSPWRRARRVGVPATIGLPHLMASSAIPGIFPPVKIDREWYGDGSVRQIAPISPALHLGARKVLVIGVSAPPGRGRHEVRKPTMADVAGHLFNSAFIDSLESDLERLQRINRTLRLVPERHRASGEIKLRPVEVLDIRPSVSLAAIASRCEGELPRAMRFFLSGTGASGAKGESVILSYLLFERGYCRALMQLGYQDAMRREAQLRRFLNLDPHARLASVPHPPQDIC